jgi:hypothetical protein
MERVKKKMTERKLGKRWKGGRKKVMGEVPKLAAIVMQTTAGAS